MAGSATGFLQVSEFSLAGIDTTQRKTIVEGPVLIAQAPGSLLTAAIDAAGTGYAANDTVAVAGGTGGVVKVLTVSSTVPQTISILANGSGYAATTGAATAAIIGSGTGLTVTTTVNKGAIIQLTSWKIVSNVLTFQAVNSLTTGGGDVITVQGFPPAQAFLNGTYTTSSATATTIVVPLTHANSAGAQQGIAVIQPTYTTGGVPIAWFYDLQGLPNPVGTIGPLSVPTWLEIETQAGSALNYKVNLTTTPPALLIFSGITQLADQAAVTADTAVFRGEWVKNAF